MTPVSFVKTTESYVKTTESYKVGRLGHHMGNTFTGKDHNGPNNRIGPDCAGRAIACLLLLFRRLDCSLVRYKLISPTNRMIIIAI